MCVIDFGLPVVQDVQLSTSEKTDSQKAAKTKVRRKHRDEDLKQEKRSNFTFFAFKDPVLFAGHLLDSSILVVEKQWMDVVQGFGPPVHRHIYGT